MLGKQSRTRSAARLLIFGCVLWISPAFGQASRIIDEGSWIPNEAVSLSSGLFIPGLWGLEGRAWSWDAMVPGLWIDVEGRWTLGTQPRIGAPGGEVLTGATRHIGFRAGPAKQRWYAHERLFALSGTRGLGYSGERLIRPAGFPIHRSSLPTFGLDFVEESRVVAGSGSFESALRPSLGWTWLSASDARVAFDGYGHFHRRVIETTTIEADYAIGDADPGIGIGLRHQVQWRGLLYGAGLRWLALPDGTLSGGDRVEGRLVLGIPFHRRRGAPPKRLDLACVTSLVDEKRDGAVRLEACEQP